MAGKRMEGNEEQQRAAARRARREGKDPSAVGATTGGSKQRQEAGPDATHQERIDLQREGKQDQLTENTPEARPGSRDPETADRERYPRL
jgi:hypothetical protein